MIAKLSLLVILHLVILPNLPILVQCAKYTPYLRYLAKGYTPYPRTHKLKEEDNTQGIYKNLPHSIFYNAKAHSQIRVDIDGCTYFGQKEINLTQELMMTSRYPGQPNFPYEGICIFFQDNNMEEFFPSDKQPSWLRLQAYLNSTGKPMSVKDDPGPLRSLVDYSWPNIPPPEHRGVYYGLFEEGNAKALFERVTEHIWTCGIDPDRYLMPQYMFIVTWLNMPAYGHNWRYWDQRPFIGYNTFQLVYVMGWSETIAITTFDEINHVTDNNWDPSRRYSGPVREGDRRTRSQLVFGTGNILEGVRIKLDHPFFKFK